MIPGMIVHAGFGQAPARGDEAVDAPPRAFVPLDVERTELREKLQVRIGQVVVDPPGHRPPVGTVRVFVREPGDDHAGGRAHMAVRVAAIPDMAGIVLFVRRAVQLVPVSEIVERGRAKTAPDVKPAEPVAQGLQQLGA